MPKPKRKADCHPDRDHLARGLCAQCYGNRPERLEYARNWRENNTDKIRNNSLKHNRGITIDDYNALFAKQDGVCAICGKQMTGKRKSLNVDHCHVTGEIRGLLCNPCNTSLPQVETEGWVDAARAYLEQPPAS